MMQRNRARAVALPAIIAVSFCAVRAGAAITVAADPNPVRLRPLPTRVVGRAELLPGRTWRRQWPGTYFETAFRGQLAYFRVGKGKVSLRLGVDGAAPIALVRPQLGYYRISLAPGPHRVRIDVASESQAGPTDFGGFWAPRNTRPLPTAARSRMIEFIGDSYTVGYGNTSRTQQCTPDDIWATTDSTLGMAPRIAARYGADFQVNAISGRGIVRNYDGFHGDTLPQAYPKMLLDTREPIADARWQPQLVIVGLGTNDFSTPLHSGEKWPTRNALRADFEASYVRFLTSLRRRYPKAWFVLWTAGRPDVEVEAEIDKVASVLVARGESRFLMATVAGLDMTGCDYHPSVADDAVIADAIGNAVDHRPEIWSPKGVKPPPS